MDTQLIGGVSGALVILSAVPYTIRFWQGKIKPQIVSWTLWSFIGLTLLLTYKSSGAEDNIWPAIFGFSNPLVITLLAFRQRSEWGKLSRWDWSCFFSGLVSLTIWVMMPRDEIGMATIALCIAIAADAFASIPTIVFVWRSPNEDRPLAWLIFALAYGLALFAVPRVDFPNLILPIFMLVGSLSIACPLCICRLKNKALLREWI